MAASHSQPGGGNRLDYRYLPLAKGRYQNKRTLHGFRHRHTGSQSPAHRTGAVPHPFAVLASYHDTAGSKEEWEDEESRRENFYHGLVLGLLACLSPAYAVESNREYGEGRPDIVVVKKGNNPAQAEEAVMLEFKHGECEGRQSPGRFGP